jgi:hypothetical protein
MKTCHACGTHVVEGLCTCPHCGARGVCARRSSAAAVLLGLALAGCADGTTPADSAEDTDIPMEADYGVPTTDDDEDGWPVEEGDCNDADASVNPGAAETAGDGVDSNCDGNDDT